jgi:transposase
MASLLLLPDATKLALTSIEFDEPTRTIVATALTPTHEACCPLCQQASCKVPSRSVRILADLPCSGQRVRWLVQVRRFRCLKADCERKIFTERLPTCAPAYARRTLRETETLCELAFALGGRAGEPLVRLLSMPVSHDTLLRLMRRHPSPEAATPRVLGVDDFAWKRGRRYGTLLIDQLLHKVVDVLPDREAETFAKWLEKHPGVEVISRDRAGNYADGARRGAPQAIQVCDRFHLLMNLQTALTRLFERKHDPLKRLAEAQEQEAVPTEIPVPSEPTTSPDPKPLTRTAVEAQARRIRRKERYEQVLRLHEQGASQVAIAALVGLDRDTVRRYLRAPASPEIVRPGRHQSKLDPYKDYLHQRMQEGQRNATHLVADLREQGYRGGSTIVRDYLRKVSGQPAWREAYHQKKQAGGLASQDQLSAREAAWLFVCNPRKLKLRQVRQLDPLRRFEEELERVSQLRQDFRVMITPRCSHRLRPWLAEVQNSGIPELRSLATGIYRDYNAVWAALTPSYSNGQTEARVPRLKLIKRLAYGRANFNLLRLRVLHGSGGPHQQKCV